MERNQFDKKDSLELGLTAQEKFISIAKSKGWLIKKSSSNEDINEHWDFRITKNGFSFRVDVESLKRISRSDEKVQDEWFWVEFHGVRSYDNGWLNGKADLIALEREKDFFIIQRTDLKELADTLVDKTKNVSRTTDARYKIYCRRKNQTDVISLMKFSDIPPEKIWDCWQKI